MRSIEPYTAKECISMWVEFSLGGRLKSAGHRTATGAEDDATDDYAAVAAYVERFMVKLKHREVVLYCLAEIPFAWRVPMEPREQRLAYWGLSEWSAHPDHEIAECATKRAFKKFKGWMQENPPPSKILRVFETA